MASPSLAYGVICLIGLFSISSAQVENFPRSNLERNIWQFAHEYLNDHYFHRDNVTSMWSIGSLAVEQSNNVDDSFNFYRFFDLIFTDSLCTKSDVNVNLPFANCPGLDPASGLGWNHHCGLTVRYDSTTLNLAERYSIYYHMCS